MENIKKTLTKAFATVACGAAGLALGSVIGAAVGYGAVQIFSQSLDLVLFPEGLNQADVQEAANRFGAVFAFFGGVVGGILAAGAVWEEGEDLLQNMRTKLKDSRSPKL